MPRKPRRAKLEIYDRQTDAGDVIWLRLSARNGEPLMHSEAVWHPKRARAAIIRSMVDVVTEDEAGLQLVVSRLREMGYTVEEDVCPKCADEAVGGGQ